MVESASTSDLASLKFSPSQPAQRDYFQLPSLDLAKYKARNLSSNPTTPSSARGTYRLPSLEFPHTQASAYWPGAAAASSPATQLFPQAQDTHNSANPPPQNTLPTPPTDLHDSAYKPPDASQPLSLRPGQQSTMMASLADSPTAQLGSLTSRRPAANNLGSMALPPLPYRPCDSAAAVMNAGNLLTPPNTSSTTMPGLLSPISAVLNNANLASNQGFQNYTQDPNPQSWNEPTGSSPPLMNPTSPPMNGLSQQLFMDRPSSTPSNLGYSISQPASAQTTNFAFPTASPPQQTPLSAPLGGFDRNSPPSASQPSFSPPSGMSNGSMGQPMASYGFRNNFNPPPFPFTPSQTLPPHMSGMSISGPPMSGPPMSGPPMSGPPLSGPPMSGPPMHLSNPIMSNMGHPGTPMSLMNMPNAIPGMLPGFHSGTAAQMFGNQIPPGGERPFHCDQCPQSFNRNHDLKRHKRIHLSVKPFPCGHCEKSFSRKDALKVGSIDPEVVLSRIKADLLSSGIFWSKVAERISQSRRLSPKAKTNRRYKAATDLDCSVSRSWNVYIHVFHNDSNTLKPTALLIIDHFFNHNQHSTLQTLSEKPRRLP